MRKLLLALPLFLAMGCAQQEKAAEPTNGFGPYEGQSVYLGDEATSDKIRTTSPKIFILANPTTKNFNA